MATHEIACAASLLVAVLLDGEERGLAEVARTGVSVHYRTGHAAVPVLCVCTPDAVLLPHSIVTAVLPPPGRLVIGDGRLRAPATTWRVRRWWRPSRPQGLPRPSRDDLARVRVPDLPAGLPVVGRVLSPEALVGLGPGLTPAGDDVVAGALVAAHATGDPRLGGWRRATAAAIDRGATTDVSRAMLHHALDGYAVPQLAAFVTALCRGADTGRAAAALLAVGHTSGSALTAGVVHTFSTDPVEPARLVQVAAAEHVPADRIPGGREPSGQETEGAA